MIDNVVELTKALIARPSVTPVDNAACLALMAQACLPQTWEHNHD